MLCAQRRVHKLGMQWCASRGTQCACCTAGTQTLARKAGMASSSTRHELSAAIKLNFLRQQFKTSCAGVCTRGQASSDPHLGIHKNSEASKTKDAWSSR